jgi:hypothetical protein
MATKLLNLQIKLLEYLTSAEAIFRHGREFPLDANLRGLNLELLHTEARFSHEKRMQKIAANFPKTLNLFGKERDAVIREFVEACPPVNISRIDNSRQFQAFLAARWNRIPPKLKYLPDVAAFELACAEAYLSSDRVSRVEAELTHSGRPSVRRKPSVVLLRTSFDIRPIFEGRSERANPVEREVTLGIDSYAGELRIYELTSEVFDLLAALGEWAELGEIPNADRLVAELAGAGLLEVRR